MKQTAQLLLPAQNKCPLREPADINLMSNLGV